MPISPDLSEDEQERPMRYPVPPLKYTQTIMGGRSGALGLRVHGKRASVSKRLSGTPRQFDVKNFIPDQAPVQEALSTPAPIPPTLVQSAPVVGSWIKMEDSDEQVSPEPTVQNPQSVVPEQVPVVKIVQFIPKFKGAAEMEARRRERMAARRGPGGVVARVPPPPTLDFSSSSENEVEPVIGEVSSDEFEEVGAAAVDGMDEGDEFDPSVLLSPIPDLLLMHISSSVFAATRTGPTSDSASDVTSPFSVGTSSIPNSSIPVSSPHANIRARPRLSPVSEHARYRQHHQLVDRSVGSSSDITSPVPKPEEPPKRSDSAALPRSRGDSTSNSASNNTTDMMFAKKKVFAMKPLKSSLSAMLASSGSSSNPFAEMYAAISGRGESQSIDIQLYFPHARQPLGKAMHLNVRSDATVEEVVGFSMWSYWEEGWLPKLDEGLSGEDDPKWATRLSAAGWILRIAEEDGEVDDDFPREMLLFSMTIVILTWQLCST